MAKGNRAGTIARPRSSVGSTSDLVAGQKEAGLAAAGATLIQIDSTQRAWRP